MKDLPRLIDQDFSNLEIQGHSGLSLIIFSADWCPYCISFFRNWNDYGRAEFVFIADITDTTSELWDSFNIEVVPTMGLFKDGKLQKRWDGILGQGLNLMQIEQVNDFFAKGTNYLE